VQAKNTSRNCRNQALAQACAVYSPFLRVDECNGDFSPIDPADCNRAVVQHAKPEPLLRPFRGSGTLRERADTKWFPVEFLMYHDERNKFRSFAYVRREDGAEIPDGHYVFLDDLGERGFRWRKRKGRWQFGWRFKADKV